MHRHDNEPVTFTRDVDAIIVPAGLAVKLRQGQQGFITQALGGSFTVYVEGNLFRIAGQGCRRARQGSGRRAAAAAECERRRRARARLGADEDLLRPGDPDQHRGPRARVRVQRQPPSRTAAVVAVTMTLTAPGCGMGEVLVQDVREKVEIIPTVKRADVELVFDPPWDQSMMSEAARLQTGMM